MQGPVSNSQVARENKQTIETESIPEPPPLLCAKDLSELDPYHLAKVFLSSTRFVLDSGSSSATIPLRRRQHSGVALQRCLDLLDGAGYEVVHGFY